MKAEPKLKLKTWTDYAQSVKQVNTMNTKMNTETKIKIADMGTTGLIQWAITGNRRMMGARIGRAKKIISLRFGTWKAVNAFNKAVNAAYDSKLN